MNTFDGITAFIKKEKYQHLAIHQDGAILTCVGGIPVIHVLINHPTPQMIADADIRAHGLKLSLFRYRNTLTMAIKPGVLPWHDAPYSPNLNLYNTPQIQECAKGEGLLTCYVFADSSDGTVLDVRAFTLPTEFSNFLLQNIHELLEMPFDPYDYQREVCRVQQMYLPQEIGECMSQVVFALPPDGAVQL